MSNSLSHSRDTSDAPILHFLDQHSSLLTLDQKAGLAIAALYTATKPKNALVSINCDCSKLINAVELLLQLSSIGKLALARAIAEELAVVEQMKRQKHEA